MIGALVRHVTLLASELVAMRCPPIAGAYYHMAHGPIRNRGRWATSATRTRPTSYRQCSPRAIALELAVPPTGRFQRGASGSLWSVRGPDGAMP